MQRLKFQDMNAILRHKIQNMNAVLRHKFENMTAMLSRINFTRIFFENRFLFTVVIPSFLWLLICAAYLSVSVGWRNLWYFLPHEIAGLVLGIVTPIIVTVVFLLSFELFSDNGLISSEMRRQGDLIRDVSRVVREIVDGMNTHKTISEETARPIEINSTGIEEIINRLNVEKMAHPIEINRAGIEEIINRLSVEEMARTIEINRAGIEEIINRLSVEEMAHPIEINSAGIEEIINRLSVVVDGNQQKVVNTDPPDINTLAALAQLVNMGLADLSVSITQLLIHLMEGEKRGKAVTIEYIEGLVDAWSMGDKNVYFRALHHQLANNPERIKLLQSLSTKSFQTSRYILKILRGMRGLNSLAKQCDKDNIIRIIIEESELWALREVLEPHFNSDGTAKA